MTLSSVQYVSYLISLLYPNPPSITNPHVSGFIIVSLLSVLLLRIPSQFLPVPLSSFHSFSSSSPCHFHPFLLSSPLLPRPVSPSPRPSNSHTSSEIPLPLLFPPPHHHSPRTCGQAGRQADGVTSSVGQNARPVGRVRGFSDLSLHSKSRHFEAHLPSLAHLSKHLTALLQARLHTALKLPGWCIDPASAKEGRYRRAFCWVLRSLPRAESRTFIVRRLW